jgi:hypothetical protein
LPGFSRQSINLRKDSLAKKMDARVISAFTRVLTLVISAFTRVLTLKARA